MPFYVFYYEFLSKFYIHYSVLFFRINRILRKSPTTCFDFLGDTYFDMDSSDDEHENCERYVIILASSKQKAFLIAMDLTKMRPLALQIFESDNDLVPRGEPICLLVPESLESSSGTRNSFYKNESLCSFKKKKKIIDFFISLPTEMKIPIIKKETKKQRLLKF